MTGTPDINKILKGIPGCNRCGADMGRRTVTDDPTDLYLQKVKLSDGGCYDAGGAYWGSPNNLWCAFRPDGEFQSFVRASNRRQAKAKFMLQHNSFADLITWRK